MNSIYIHIPFCKQLCFYCDFHFSLLLTKTDEVFEAMMTEIELQKDYLNAPINTLYFGGGTPSLLSANQINRFWTKLSSCFDMSIVREITLEVNPDDLTEKYLTDLLKTPVNRLSIGIQSFFDEHLILMNRRHKAKQAYEAVQKAKQIGFKNISIDLIFGLPYMTHEQLKQNLMFFLALDIPHLSAYHLTYEPYTAFYNMMKKQKIDTITEEQSLEQYTLIMNTMSLNGYIQYELSNYAKPEYFSQHNTAYWQEAKYLGIGPSAHSYNLTSRQWNVANNLEYVTQIANKKLPNEIEYLDTVTLYNEYILKGLRTMWGINLYKIEQVFGDKFARFAQKNLQPFLNKKEAIQTQQTVVLSQTGKFIADKITRELFWTQ